MRIGIDTTGIEDNPAGVGTFVGEVIKELEGREDLELVLFSAKSRSFIKHYELFKKIKSSKLDVIWQLGGWLPLFVPKGVKKIQTVHDLISYGHPEWFPQRGISRFWSQRIRVPFATSSADVVHAISHYTQKELTRLNFGGEKIVVAYQGVSVPAVVDQGKIPDQLHGKKYLVIVGTVEPRKNIINAVKAFRSLTTKDNECCLVIIGKQGWGTDLILDEINAVGDCAIYLGYVDDDTKFAIIKNARGLVMTSFEEGFGRPIVEAMRLGVPVMASANSGMQEVAEDSAIMVFPNDIKKIAHGMERLLNHDVLRGRLIVLGHERAKRFSTKRMVDDVLKKLL